MPSARAQRSGRSHLPWRVRQRHPTMLRVAHARPESFGQFIQTESDRYGGIIKRAGIKLE